MWSRYLGATAAAALDVGDIVEGTDLDQLELELTSLLERASTSSLLHGDDTL